MLVPILFLIIATLLPDTSRGAGPPVLGFPGVDGSIRDGLLHNPPNVHVAVGMGSGASGRVVMVTSAGVQIWDENGISLDGPLPLDAFFGTAIGSIGQAQTCSISTPGAS